MVVQEETNDRLLEKVERIYTWLDGEIAGHSDLADACRACGACCDFGAFGHRLFVTTPEIMYLSAKLGPENIKPMTTTRCPYQADGRCTIYQNRFAGCRIFYCKADKNFQSALSGTALKRLKAICEELQIQYQYTDLATALNGFAG